jgi:hypothetical protein
MDIQTFVTETLNQIIKGVEQAQEMNINSKVHPADTAPGKPILTEIDFDIAVTVEKTAQSSDEAKGKISVRTGIVDFGGGVGGDSQKTESNATTSRIKFTIPVALRKTGSHVEVFHPKAVEKL